MPATTNVSKLLNITRPGVVASIHAAQNGAVVIFIKHGRAFSPMLLLTDAKLSQQHLVELSPSDNTSWIEDVFVYDSLIVYLKRESSGICLYKYDIATRVKTRISDSLYPNILNLAHHAEKILWFEKDEITVYDYARDEIDGRVVCSEEIPLAKILDKGYIFLIEGHQLVLSGFLSGKAVILDVATGSTRGELSGDFKVLNKVISTEKFIVGTDCDLNGVYVWNKVDLSPIRNEYVSNAAVSVYCYALSADEEWLAWGDWRGFVHVIQITSGRVLYKKKLSRNRIMSIGFTLESGILLAGGEKAEIWLVDLNQ